MKQKDIDKLVKEARDGKNEAFGKLIIYYKDDLYRIVRARIGLSDDDICDIVQETILAMYSSINKLKEISSFKGWMIRILINKCNDVFRKKSIIETVSFEEHGYENYLIAEPVTDSTMELESVMKNLTYEERLIILLHYEHGYTTKEISKILNMKDGTIRSKLSRAREKILKMDKGELKV